MAAWWTVVIAAWRSVIHRCRTVVDRLLPVHRLRLVVDRWRLLHIDRLRLRATSISSSVLLFHGNAGNLGDRHERVQPYLEHGFGMLLVGYRGYGGSEGTKYRIMAMEQEFDVTRHQPCDRSPSGPVMK